uniref:Uncharacterized protein n=1 Tax=Rousettus aegyptiacus TaxID=9407 RepID=A0A7J8C246_ROUAE|nr:hypothetical protein HJG63_009264 [Rousettus aegyptiacus]
MLTMVTRLKRGPVRFPVWRGLRRRGRSTSVTGEGRGVAATTTHCRRRPGPRPGECGTLNLDCQVIPQHLSGQPAAPWLCLRGPPSRAWRGWRKALRRKLVSGAHCERGRTRGQSTGTPKAFATQR